MSSSIKPSRCEQTQSLPGDPRFWVVFKPRASDVARLPKQDMLSTALLDYIINLTTIVPDSSSITEPGVQSFSQMVQRRRELPRSGLHLFCLPKEMNLPMWTSWMVVMTKNCSYSWLLSTKPQFVKPLNNTDVECSPFRSGKNASGTLLVLLQLSSMCSPKSMQICPPSTNYSHHRNRGSKQQPKVISPPQKQNREPIHHWHRAEQENNLLQQRHRHWKPQVSRHISLTLQFASLIASPFHHPSRRSIGLAHNATNWKTSAVQTRQKALTSALIVKQSVPLQMKYRMQLCP